MAPALLALALLGTSCGPLAGSTTDGASARVSAAAVAAPAASAGALRAASRVALDSHERIQATLPAFARRAAPATTVPAAPAPPAPAPQPAARPAPLVAPGSDHTMDEFFVHVPPTVDGRLRVLVALHGMQGNGPAFCQPLRARADREGWLLVAPTYPYGNWQDPAEVAREESAGFIPRLHDFLAALPARTGLDLAPRAVIYGASRGGQLAHRFALVYPEQTRAVAAIAPGSWTLPTSLAEVDGDRQPLPYPFGTADLQQRFGRDLDLATFQRIPFWVGVGDLDRDPAEVPRQWDPYLGTSRVARAESFVRRLAELGASAELTYFPGLGHTLTDEMQARALDFLAGVQ